MEFKIPPRVVYADDCIVRDRQIGESGEIMESEGYAIHKGEWVAIYPVLTVGDRQTLIDAYQAFIGGVDTDKVSAEAEMLVTISRNIVGWNWTDMTGQAYPEPYQNLDAMKMLTPDEVLWLWKTVIDESQGERKKDWSPSQKKSSRARGKLTKVL